MKKITSIFLAVCMFLCYASVLVNAEGEIEIRKPADKSNITPDDNEIRIALSEECELVEVYLDGILIETFENTNDIFYSMDTPYTLGKHNMEVIAISEGAAQSKKISFTASKNLENYAFNFGFDGEANQDAPHANDFYYTGVGAGNAKMSYETDLVSGNTYLKAVADGGEWSSSGAHDMIIHFYRNIPISTPFTYSYDVCISEVRSGYCMADSGAESYKMGIVFPDIKFGSSTYSGRKMAGVLRDKTDGKLKIAKNPGTEDGESFVSYASVEIEQGKWYRIKTDFNPAKKTATSYMVDINSGAHTLICEDKNFTATGAITDLQIKAWGKSDVFYDNFRLCYSDGNISYEKEGEYVASENDTVMAGTRKIKISKAKYLLDADIKELVSATENGQSINVESAVISGGDIEIAFENPLLFHSDIVIHISDKLLLSDNTEVGYTTEYFFKTAPGEVETRGISYKAGEKDILSCRQLKGGDTVNINAEMVNHSGEEKSLYIAAYALCDNRVCAVSAVPYLMTGDDEAKNIPLEITLPEEDGVFNIEVYTFGSFENAQPLSKAYTIK